MMVSLVRTAAGGLLEFRAIVERSGRLVSRLTTYRRGGTTSGGPEEDLGHAASPSADETACAQLRRARTEGFRVLYAYVLPEVSPRTHGFLSGLPGVEVQPDHRDGVPVWSPGARTRGGKISYLLFTVLSSEAK